MRLARFFIALTCGLLAADQTWAAQCKLKEYGSLQVEMINHIPTTMTKINGMDARFVIGTGFWFSAMSRGEMEKMGLKSEALPPYIRSVGAYGMSGERYTRIKEFGIFGTTLNNTQFVVDDLRSGTGVIGVNLLDSADLEIDLAHGKMRLFKPDGCDNSPLAYWAREGDYSEVEFESKVHGQNEHRTIVPIKVNGKILRAMINTGAPISLLSHDAAEHVGIDVDKLEADLGPPISARRTAPDTWTVTIDSFSIGAEVVQHASMNVSDGALAEGKVDVLLGADFLLAHHLFISNSQRKVYFTYNGGPPFVHAGQP